MKAAGAFVASVLTLEAFVTIQAALIASGLQQTQSTVLSVAAIIGGLGVIAAGLRRAWMLGKRAAHVGDVVLGLDARVERIEARQGIAAERLSRIEERLGVGGPERRTTDRPPPPRHLA